MGRSKPLRRSDDIQTRFPRDPTAGNLQGDTLQSGGSLEETRLSLSNKLDPVLQDSKTPSYRDLKKTSSPREGAAPFSLQKDAPFKPGQPLFLSKEPNKSSTGITYQYEDDLAPHHSDLHKYKVLLAVDKHWYSEYAAEWLMKHYLNPENHILYIVSVTKDSPHAAMIYSAGVDAGVNTETLEDIHDESTSKCRVILAKYYKRFYEAYGEALTVHCLLGQGEKRDEICEVARKISADLLVLGCGGHSAWKR